MRTKDAVREAKRRGVKAGKARASWVFDGNTTSQTYLDTLGGIEDGDPAVLDRLEWSPLSGEWAGESVSELLGDLLDGKDDDATDAITEAYDTAASDAYWHEIERVCRYHLEDN